MLGVLFEGWRSLESLHGSLRINIYKFLKKKI